MVASCFGMKTKKHKMIITNPAFRREFWLGIVIAYLRSGESAVRFAGKQGLSIHSLRDWTKRFRREFGEDWVTEQQTGRTTSNTDEGHFVEVKEQAFLHATKNQSSTCSCSLLTFEYQSALNILTTGFVLPILRSAESMKRIFFPDSIIL